MVHPDDTTQKFYDFLAQYYFENSINVNKLDSRTLKSFLPELELFVKHNNLNLQEKTNLLKAMSHINKDLASTASPPIPPVHSMDLVLQSGMREINESIARSGRKDSPHTPIKNKPHP